MLKFLWFKLVLKSWTTYWISQVFEDELMRLETVQAETRNGSEMGDSFKWEWPTFISNLKKKYQKGAEFKHSFFFIIYIQSFIEVPNVALLHWNLEFHNFMKETFKAGSNFGKYQYFNPIWCLFYELRLLHWLLVAVGLTQIIFESSKQKSTNKQTNRQTSAGQTNKMNNKSAKTRM